MFTATARKLTVPIKKLKHHSHVYSIVTAHIVGGANMSILHGGFFEELSETCNKAVTTATLLLCTCQGHSTAMGVCRSGVFSSHVKQSCIVYSLNSQKFPGCFSSYK